MKDKLTIKEFITNKQYRAILSLTIYFVIFLVLILVLRLGGSTSTNKDNNSNTPNDTIVSSIEGFNYIKGKNFNFIYTIKENDKEYICDGKQYEDLILFDLENKNYYSKNGVFSVKENNKYVLTDYLTNYFELFDIDNLEKILEKTVLKGDKYTISLKEFLTIIKSKLNVTEDRNMLVEITRQNGIITKISIDISSYINQIDGKITTSSITYEYKNFHLIDKFEVK